MQETPRISWWQRLMQTSTAAKVGIVAGVVIFSCGLCACMSIASLAALGSVASHVTIPAPTSASRPIGTPTRLTPTASAVLPSPTSHSTDGPQPVPGVVTASLGGPVQAFYAKYGTEADNLFDVNGVTFSLNDDTGADGMPHVFEMMVYPSDASQWTLEQAKPICTPFLPPDATFNRSIATSDGNPEDVYVSLKAHESFATASPWYTADGTISILYEHHRVGGSGIWQCHLSMGV